MEEAVHAEALRLDLAAAAPASTSCRHGPRPCTGSSGPAPDTASRFRHHRHHRLPHDVIIVDETSMVALSLMARLLEAVRPDARLILVGDPEQLASVEAGAVLGDIVGPALHGPLVTPAARARLGRFTGAAPPARPPSPADTVAALATLVVVLRSNYRFGGSLAELATAVRSGNEDEVIRILSSDDESLRWVEMADSVDWSAPAASTALQPIRDMATAAGTALFEGAAGRDGEAALDALARFRFLCAHRHGPSGVSSWTKRIEDWVSVSLAEFGTGTSWYLGRPVMVTANDYGLRLFNGDTGVVVAREDGGVTVAFRRAGALVTISPARLTTADTVFAMTVHKAQGSEFREVAVMLPPSTSAVLTRQLLYTAITRAQERLVVAGSEMALRMASHARSPGLPA